MPNCKFCGAEIAENTKFCSNCGAKIQTAPVVDVIPEEEFDSKTNEGSTSDAHSNTSFANQAPPVYTKRPIKGGLLAWSIVNASLGLMGCCSCLPVISLILGVASIVLVILAQDAQSDSAEKTKIRYATVLNIISSAIFVISIILFIAFIFIGSMQVVPYNNFNLDEFLRMYPYLD